MWKICIYTHNAFFSECYIVCLLWDVCLHDNNKVSNYIFIYIYSLLACWELSLLHLLILQHLLYHVYGTTLFLFCRWGDGSYIKTSLRQEACNIFFYTSDIRDLFKAKSLWIAWTCRKSSVSQTGLHSTWSDSLNTLYHSLSHKQNLTGSGLIQWSLLKSLITSPKQATAHRGPKPQP